MLIVLCKAPLSVQPFIMSPTLILETASSACIMRVALVGCPSHTCGGSRGISAIYGEIWGGWEEVLWGNDEKLRGEETHQLRRPEVPRAEEHSLDENFGVGDDWNGKDRGFKRGIHVERFLCQILN